MTHYAKNNCYVVTTLDLLKIFLFRLRKVTNLNWNKMENQLIAPYKPVLNKTIQFWLVIYTMYSLIDFQECE